MGDTRLIYTTWPNAESAAPAAKELVSKRLAACATVLAGALSYFMWEGEVQGETEVMIQIPPDRRGVWPACVSESVPTARADAGFSNAVLSRCVWPVACGSLPPKRQPRPRITACGSFYGIKGRRRFGVGRHRINHRRVRRPPDPCH